MTDKDKFEPVRSTSPEFGPGDTGPVKWPEPSKRDRALDAKADALADENGMFPEGRYSPEWIPCWLFVASRRDFLETFVAGDGMSAQRICLIGRKPCRLS
jgi:hypothetical protein